jgi:Predicted membrane protein
MNINIPLPQILMIWILFMSLILFIMMGVDKKKAQLQVLRIPEKTLFFAAIIGGAPGGWIGMQFFHHKTKHWYFKIGFPILALIEIGAVLYLKYFC